MNEYKCGHSRGEHVEMGGCAVGWREPSPHALGCKCQCFDQRAACEHGLGKECGKPAWRKRGGRWVSSARPPRPSAVFLG